MKTLTQYELQAETWRAYHNPITKTSVVAFEADGPPITKQIEPERANLIAAAPELLRTMSTLLDKITLYLGPAEVPAEVVYAIRDAVTAVQKAVPS